jgi:hypothetical protein
MEPAAEIAFAEREDAAGRHDAAIDALARATKRGDVEAMTRLGKRLLTGDAAPHLPADGARLLVDAAAAGGAEAAARCAVLAALGAYVAQSWGDALEMLVLAAERGSSDARGVLAALSPHAAARDAASDAARWRESARAIDLRAWLTALPTHALRQDPVVRSVPAVVTGSVAQWLIGRTVGRLERARVYDGFAGDEAASEQRTNRAASFSLAEVDFAQVLLQARMAAICGVPLGQLEAPAILHYDVGEQITDHFDFVDPRTPHYAEQLAKHGQRVITFLVYLNDDYDGGETAFPRIGVEHKGRCGDGLFFVNVLPTREPDLRTAHAGRPPTRGEKWVVSQFIRDRRVLDTPRG